MLQFASDQPVLWIDGLILSTGTISFIARLLQSEFKLTQLLSVLATTRPHGGKGRLYTKRLQPRDDFQADRAIHTQAAKRNASVSAMIYLAATAVIAANAATRAAVGHMKLPTTVAAAKESGKNGFTTAD